MVAYDAQGHVGHLGRAAGAFESHASQRRLPHPAPLHGCARLTPLPMERNPHSARVQACSTRTASCSHHAALKLSHSSCMCVDEARERALASEMAAEGTLHPGLRALPGSRTAVVRTVPHVVILTTEWSIWPRLTVKPRLVYT
jgi:hypothetical protein